MNETILLRLDRNDVGQILEGLQAREESWRKTAMFLRDGFYPGDVFICEECSKFEEADGIANHYQRIITNIERQIR